MFSHVSVGTADLHCAAKFYDALLIPLGLRRRPVAADGGPEAACWIAADGKLPRFYVYRPFDGMPATVGNGSMVAFLAPSADAVDHAYAAGLKAGGRDEDAPGERSRYGAGYYGAYIRDPDGNKVHIAFRGDLCGGNPPYTGRSFARSEAASPSGMASRQRRGDPMTHLQVLTRYKAWADGVFLSAICAVPPAELTAPRPIVFGSLIRTLHHAYAMDYVWQCHLTGKPHGLTTRNPEHCPALAELAEKQRATDAWYVDYADSLSENELAQTIEFEFIGGGTGCMTRRDIILHVVNHTTYHRGHAAAILYYLGIFPPTTDLPVFLQQSSPSGQLAVD